MLVFGNCDSNTAIFQSQKIAGRTKTQSEIDDAYRAKHMNAMVTHLYKGFLLAFICLVYLIACV